MRWTGHVIAVLLAGWSGSGLAAQESGREPDLPIAGTLIYNFLRLSRPPDVEHGSYSARFAGRLAFRAAPRTYVGAGVGSWVQTQTRRCLPEGCGEFADYWSEAMVYQVYLQHRPHPTVPAWGRIGLGIANTYTLVPDGGWISVADRWRFRRHGRGRCRPGPQRPHLPHAVARLHHAYRCPGEQPRAAPRPGARPRAHDPLSRDRS